MKIEFNKVTTLSKFLAAILFIALPLIYFFYGIKYGYSLGILHQASKQNILFQDVVDYSKNP